MINGVPYWLLVNGGGRRISWPNRLIEFLLALFTIVQGSRLHFVKADPDGGRLGKRLIVERILRDVLTLGRRQRAAVLQNFLFVEAVFAPEAFSQRFPASNCRLAAHNVGHRHALLEARHFVGLLLVNVFEFLLFDDCIVACRGRKRHPLARQILCQHYHLMIKDSLSLPLASSALIERRKATRATSTDDCVTSVSVGCVLRHSFSKRERPASLK